MNLGLLLFLCKVLTVSSGVELVAILPHGDWAYDPYPIGGVNGSSELHAATLNISKQIVTVSPEVIIMISPHAVALDDDYGVYLSSGAEGFADIGLDAHNSSVAVYRIYEKARMDPALAQTVIKSLRASGVGSHAISFFSSAEPAPLRWGEVIPLAMLSGSEQKDSDR